jgi:deoxyribodipyrimidine photo-lyase
MPDSSKATHCTASGTRAAGLERLAGFVPRAGRAYAAARNEDRGIGGRQAVSGLSPWIRHRLVTEAEVLEAVLSTHTPAAAAIFIEELCWRGYFKGHLEARPSIWAEYRRALANLRGQVARRGMLADAVDRATSGQTGIDCIDAWVPELRDTGYLHNHARMVFASIWIFTLKLPWQLGADFMYRHLLDGDPASNTLGWRWVAGLHTAGKRYLARADIVTQCSGGRFAPEGLAQDAAPLTESASHPRVALPAAVTSPPTGRFALLLTEEDLHPESLGIDPGQVIGVAGAVTPGSRSPWLVSEHVLRFTKDAMADALARAAVNFACPVETLGGLDGDSIAEWAERIGATTVLTPCTPVGPVEETLADAGYWLSMRRLKLLQLRRHYDGTLWPFATRGFFDLRERIPQILAALNLQTGKPQQGELRF